MALKTAPDCIFCKIVAGTIPCFKLYEDDATLAFLDINPAQPGHARSFILNQLLVSFYLRGDVSIGVSSALPHSDQLR